MAGLIKLRDYQQQGIDQLYEKLKQGKKRVIFVLQTGGLSMTRLGHWRSAS